MITVTSLNANGLRNITKMKEVKFTYRSDIICIQETNWDDEKVKEVKEIWKGDIFYNNGARNARGVAIMIKKDKVENVRQVYRDNIGRILVLEFEYKGIEFRLINIYVPNIENDKRICMEELKGLILGRCIIVGDFNTKCSRLDVWKGGSFRWEKSRLMLMDIMEDKGLLDVWRYENPEKREFTRRQMKDGVLKQSRIDLVLAQRDAIEYIEEVRHQRNHFSDHDGVRFGIKVGKKEVSGGLWILNAGYIEEDKYRQQIKELLNQENLWLEECLKENELNDDIATRWEVTKDKIKILSISYGKERKKIMRKDERKLKERVKIELSKAEDEEGYSIEKYIEAKMDLERYEREKCRGAILRSKAKYTLEGERCTKYFLGLEKRRQCKTYIHEIH